MERRFLPATRRPVTLEERGTDPPAITGYGAVYYNAADPGTQFEIFPGLVERLMPGCFDCAVRDCDVRALFNHDPNMILGRKSAGTLSLRLDNIGLGYNIVQPDTQAGRDLVVSLRRGDITGSSFSFVPMKVTWIEQKAGPTIREIRELELYDVGPVTFPAYGSTTAGMRAIDGQDQARQDYEAWKQNLAAGRAFLAAHRDQIEARARCVELGV